MIGNQENKGVYRTWSPVSFTKGKQIILGIGVLNELSFRYVKNG
jgi:hypothetical protein